MNVKLKNNIRPLTDEIINEVVAYGNGWGPDAYWCLFEYASGGDHDNYDIGNDDVFLIYSKSKSRKIPVKFSDLYILINDCRREERIEQRNSKLDQLGI